MGGDLDQRDAGAEMTAQCRDGGAVGLGASEGAVLGVEARPAFLILAADVGIRYQSPNLCM